MYNFYNNYNYVISIFKCYKSLDIENPLLHNNKTNKHYNFFISRIKKLSKFNCYYKRNNYTFKIRNIEQSLLKVYNNGLIKNLNRLNKLYLTYKTKYYSNTAVSDISFLYYDKIENNNYVDHLDEKYNFFRKNILSKKIINQLDKNNYLNKKKNLYSSKHKKNTFSISPLIHKNNYNYIFTYLNINNKLSNNKKLSTFYSLHIIK